MSQIQGPALFLAQFAQDIPPYNTLENITQWAKGLGFIGVQIPAWDKRLIDLDKAARMPNIILRPGQVSMVAIKIGKTAQGVSAARGMDRLTSSVSSRN